MNNGKERRDANDRNDRMESYPLPTETDKQLNNQPEYEDQQPNSFEDKSISDVPNSPARDQSDAPGGDRA